MPADPNAHAPSLPDAAATDARNELVVQHLSLVRIIAAKLYRMRWNSSVEFDEYYQMGAMGLIEAAGHFDPARGVQFGTFASWRISGSILNGLVRSTEQHQQIASRRHLVASRVEALAEVQTVDPSVEAALSRIAEVAVGLAVGFMLEGTGMFDAGLGREHLDGYASLALRQTRQKLHATLATLPAQERAVLEGHYLQQQPFTDLADALGLSRGRISQIHRAGLERLRAILRRDPSSFEA